MLGRGGGWGDVWVRSCPPRFLPLSHSVIFPFQGGLAFPDHIFRQGFPWAGGEWIPWGIEKCPARDWQGIGCCMSVGTFTFLQRKRIFRKGRCLGQGEGEMRVEKEGERTASEPGSPVHPFPSCRRIQFSRIANLSEPIGAKYRILKIQLFCETRNV